MSEPCEVPPCPPCPPLGPPPCLQTCPPPPPLPPCRHKPIMRGLHWSQTKSKMAQAFLLSIVGGIALTSLIALPRRNAYLKYYSTAEFDDQADEMARKGLFQSVPPEALKNHQHMHKK